MKPQDKLRKGGTPSPAASSNGSASPGDAIEPEVILMDDVFGS